MKRLYILLVILFSTFSVRSQTYENSWINYSQNYYKIKIAQEGIYRIPVSTLLFAGIPVTGMDHRTMQLFHNGQEQYIYIYDQNGNFQLDGSDYVEFYGQRNDGSLDTKLYRDSTWQPNVNYSLFTDTSIYFLTFNTSLANRRITLMTDTNYNVLSPAGYFTKESYKEETNSYNEGATNTYNATEIDYTETEGWEDVSFSTNNPVSKVLNTQNMYVNGPNIEINTVLAGANSNDHNITINFPGVNFSDFYTGYHLRRYHFSLSPAAFTSSSTTFTYNAVTPGTLPDYNKFVNLSVKYPHTYDLENASAFRMFVQDASSQPKTRMDITNFNTGGTPEIILYDLTNHRRYPVVQAGNTWHAVVDNDLQTKPKTCYIVAVNQVQSISSISSSAYVSNNPGLFNNLTIPKDSAYLIITHRSLWNQALAYKTYRDFTTNNKVILIDIDELYDQFAYGIKQHPLAIKNFVKYILDNWTTVHPPQALFLVGKSIASRFTRTNAQNFTNNLVPSFGNPPSDVLLTAGLNGSVYEPKIPTGRLSALNPGQVNGYLQKAQDYETAQATLPPATWMKEVLHFGGGSSGSEQDLLRYFLNEFKRIIEDTSYGGHVTSYFKTSSAPIFIDQSRELQDRINAGVSLMTFFGHASGSDFDQSTDVPENYGNLGKYPLVIANSCFAGDIHTATPSISERFVTLPDKGSIGFIASVGLGDAGYLFLYSSNLYKNIAYKNYGQSIGKIMQQTIRDVQDTGNEGTKIVCQEMTLEGDPGIKPNNWKKPDYLMEPSNIYFTPTSITTDLDTFTVHVIVRNIAKAVPDSFNVVITRTFPNGTDSVYTVRIGHCYYADTLQLSMHVNGFNSAGINTFKSDVDLPLNTVDEIENQFNNTASAFLFITSLDAIPVYPPKFAIVPYNTVALKASTSDPLAGMKTYRFEMDTSYQAFGNPPQYSPMFRFATVTDSGGVITWSNNIQLLDSVVYYWRVANDSIQNNPVRYKWRESSFIHIPNKTGWSQKHFYQFNEDKYTNVIPDSFNRKFNFVQNTKSLNALTHASLANDVGFTMNNSVTDGEYTNACTVSPSVMIAVIDSITLRAWSTCDHTVGQENLFTLLSGICGDPANPPQGTNSCVGGNINGRSRPENIFSFRYNSPAEMLAFKNLMQSGVPAGDYILAYSWNIIDYSTVDPNFIAGLNAAGFQSSALLPNAPYIFFIQQGHPVPEHHVIGTSSQDTINFSIALFGVWDRGTIVTDLIGPSSQWNELHWKEHTIDAGITKDTTALNLYGLNAITNAFDTLRYGIQTTSFDTTLNWISAAQYPYLKMEVYLKDDALRTPPQMDKWQIYYEEVPECAVNANHNFSFHGSPISEGDTARLSIAIDNIANKPMDSLTVDFYLFDNNRVRHNLKSIKMDSLRVGQSLLATIEMDTTLGFSGNNSLWVEANPNGIHHQLEQYHFNNLAEVKFKVNRDVINPILDVTFDGIHILDRDIISGKPNISVQLHDENKFLALNDTSNFRVYLKSPSSNTEQRIYFAPPAYGSALRFTPAVLPKNSCRIDWNPVLTEDGIYTLSVEATDISKNESGKYNYRISFEVINKSTITEVLNYPNPFSTSTRFVFTLTGNEIPGYMKIQVMTVTGKIIREITQRELGNIHIGRNITDYAWDGKDEYGDQLANGVYLYRVITSIGGNTIEHRETEVDKFFKKGWGKMYLMR